MSLIKRNGNVLPHVPALFDDFFSRDFFNWGNNNFSSTSTSIPLVNIKENNERFVVEMAAPGMDKDDFKVRLDGNQLTISSSKESRDEQKEEGFTRREFSYQSFQRRFELPREVVDAANITAKYENGLLHLTIPKKEEARQQAPRMIAVS